MYSKLYIQYRCVLWASQEMAINPLQAFGVKSLGSIDTNPLNAITKTNFQQYLKDVTSVGIPKGVTDLKYNNIGDLLSDGELSSLDTLQNQLTGNSGVDYVTDTNLPQDQFGYKVRLFAVRNFPSEYVVFEVSPTLSESRSVEYANVVPVHMPGSIQIYRKTNSRQFSLSATFISRNTSQATTNMKYLQQLRGWTMPYFGLRSRYSGVTSPVDNTTEASQPTETTSDDSSSILGAPPDVLYMYAYSSSNNDGSDRTSPSGQINLKKIPVVITSLSIDYPNDVDYIPVSDTGEPFPVKMEVRLELAETHSPKGYENFSLSMFKQGLLVQF